MEKIKIENKSFKKVVVLGIALVLITSFLVSAGSLNIGNVFGNPSYKEDGRVKAEGNPLPVLLSNPPGGFTATANSRTQIDLSWTKNSTADTTYIERNNAETWNLGEGTMVYNDSGTSYQDSGLNPGNQYFYKAWSWNDTDLFSTSYEETNATTFTNQPPLLSGENPLDDSGNIDITQAMVNVTIRDPEGDSFDWTIEGLYVTDSGQDNDVNGSKSANLITPLLYDTDIVWFVNVTDGYSWTNATYNFTTVQAQYTLTVNVVGSGSFLKSPDQSTYTYGTVVQLTAVADSGWTFSQWSGDLVSSLNPDNVTMDGDKVVTVTFTEDGYTLTVNVVGNGSFLKSPDQLTYTYGTVVELTAVADPGWTFSSWSEDLGGSVNPESITMDGDKVVNATFTEDEYVLTVNVVGSGSVLKSPDQLTYTYGTVVELTAVADPGWTFSQWSGDLVSSLNPDNVTMDGDKVVVANFSNVLVNYSLTIIIEGNGYVTKNPNYTNYSYGSVVKLTAAPTFVDVINKIGWKFDHWEGDAKANGTSNPINIKIDYHKSIIANFSKIIDSESPSNVTGLTVTDAKDGKLYISWIKATDDMDQYGIPVHHYEIHRNDILIINVSGVSYQDTGLTNGRSYSYQICAVDFSGNKGNLSNAVSGTPTASGGDDDDDDDDDSGGGDNGGNSKIPVPPVAYANGPYVGLTYQNITFNASGSSDLDGSITNYTWDFGDNTTGYGVSPIHSYNISGLFNITLIVTDNDEIVIQPQLASHRSPMMMTIVMM